MSPSDIIKYVDVDICVQTPYGFERASALLFSKLRAVGRTEIWKSELGSVNVFPRIYSGAHNLLIVFPESLGVSLALGRRGIPQTRSQD